MHSETAHTNLQEYVDGQLTPAQTLAIEDHLATCAACRQELSLLRQVDETLAQQPVLQEPADLTAQIMARVRAATPVQVRLPWLPWRAIQTYWADAAVSAAFAWAAVTVLIAPSVLWPQHVMPLEEQLQQAWWTWVPRIERMWHIVRLDAVPLTGVLSSLCVAAATAALAAILTRQCLGWTTSRPRA
jgi:anti-sigma factor RsiW